MTKRYVKGKIRCWLKEIELKNKLIFNFKVIMFK